MEKPIKVTVLPAKEPVSREELGEIAEKLFQILARARARKREAASDQTRNPASNRSATDDTAA